MRRLVVYSLGLALALGPLGARADHGDEPGVAEETITLGLHVPFSGAAPIVDPQAVRVGADLYWRHLHDDRGLLVHGRRVEVIVENDASGPSTAVQRCHEMAQDSLLLLGFVGTDQINSCAGYADPRGIPYLSPGVQEAGLTGRATYFALSATWVQQSTIIADYVANVLGETADRYSRTTVGPTPPSCGPFRVPIVEVEIPNPLCPPQPPPDRNPHPDAPVQVGLVRPNTPNYDDADDALRALFAERGYGYRTYAMVKEGNSAEAAQFARRMKQDAIDVVVILSGPYFTTTLVREAASVDHVPHYVMYGLTAGYDYVLQDACEQGELDGASAFSPWPAATSMADGEFDPDMAVAAEIHAAHIDPTSYDLLVALWGLMKNVHFLLEAAGDHPSREEFLAMLDAGYAHATGVFPDFQVDAENHFGGQAMHRLQASCEDRRFHQADSFVTGYPPSEED